MKITCINHNENRDLTQLAWAIFSNEEGEIISKKQDDIIKTSIEYNGEIYKNTRKYIEKNDIKRSLLECAKSFYDVDVPWGILTGINPSKLAFENFETDEFCEKYQVEKLQASLCEKTADFAKSLIVNEEDICVYISIPFCKSKCAYCSFVSNSIDTANKNMTKYIDCLILEIKTVANALKNRKIKAIYIGGGTPTALDIENFERLLKTVAENFDFENVLEYTVEAGRVDTINDEKLELLKKYNVDRISINPQVFDDEILKKVGRNHTVQDVFDIYEKARKLNFKAINMDLIYGLGGDFDKTVDEVLKLNPENITIHTLAIKKGSKIDKNYTASLTDINYFYDKIFENYIPYYMYRQQYMIKPYENVGFYRNNTPCLYNVYMMQNLMDIVALGSGASSKIAGQSNFNNKYPVDYINNIEKIINDKENLFK